MLPALLHSPLILLEVLFIFNLIIVVHELGHFWAARWRGLVVDEFGVWFGKPLWRRKLGGVWYSLGSIPAGGFVKLPQLAPMEAIEGESEHRTEPLPPISPLDKIIVALAGPVFSFLLALGMATLVWGIGKPVDEFAETTTIGYVVPGGPADRAGLKPGDRILEVDGKPVKRFIGARNSVTWHVARSEGETIPFKIEREGKTLVIESGWTREESPKWQRKGLRKVMIAQRYAPSVGEVKPDSAAQQAGLQPGDVITALQGEPIASIDTLYKRLGSAPTSPATLSVRRGDASLELSLPSAPAVPGKSDPELGIAWGRVTLSHPTPVEQVTDAVLTIREMLEAWFSPKSDVKAQHFSGPVGIAKAYYTLFSRDHGWRLAIAFSVFFNVNLAIFNLLPFPVLDGGHITLALLEAVRRKPISGAFLEWVQTGCALAVMAFLAYVTFFDLSDFFSPLKAKPSSASLPAPQPVLSAPAKTSDPSTQPK